MDESWRMRMGIDNNLPRRRSTEERLSERMMRRSVFDLNYNIATTTTTTSSSNNSLSSDQALLIDPDNFKDVFGGPPRSVISRQFSGDFIIGGGNNNRSTSSSNNNTFYEEIFRSSELVAQAKRGKKLPVFRIPTKNGSNGGEGGAYRRSHDDGFFDDIFGSDEDRNRSKSQSGMMKTNSKTKSKSKSMSNSSSVLSSEDLSPLRPSIAEDVFFTSFSSNLRPINVPGRRKSSSMHSKEQQQQRRGVSTSDIPWIHPPFTDHHQFIEQDLNHENYRSSSSHFGFSKSISSPETISIEPNSCRSIKLSLDDLDPDSPISIVSLHRDAETSFNQNKVSYEQEEEDEIMSSYVIEINSNNKKDTSGEAVGIEEAIAWAKEKFQAQMLEAFESGNQKHGMRLGAKEPIAEKQG